MARHSPNERLTSLLAEADWSAGELARAVNRLGRAQSLTLRYDQTSVAHWRNGARPRDTVAALVAAAFSRRIGRLVTVEEAGLTDPVLKPGLREGSGAAHRSPNEHLRPLLVEADWSAGELARAVNRLGGEQSLTLRYDRSSVAHWRKGVRPSGTVAALVAAAFSRRIGRLVTVEETGLADSFLKPGLSFRDHIGATPLERLVILVRADCSPPDRPLLAQAAYSLAAIPLPEWQREPTSRPLSGARRRATVHDVEAIQTVSKIVAAQTERFGGKHGRSALAAYLADDVSRILTANASSVLHRELLTSTAQLTHLLAMMTSDSGHHGLAQLYYHTALELARDAGNPVAYAIILRAMSAQALQLGHPRQALDLAEAAVTVSGSGAEGAARAFLLSQLAVARAYDGQRHGSISSLAAAEACLDKTPSTPGPFTAYPRAGLEYQRAQTLLRLGLRTEALTALNDSARHRAPDRHRTSALTEFRLGELLMSIGHLEEACLHWEQFLERSQYLRSARIDQALSELHKRLRPYHRQRHASAVWERVRELTSDVSGAP